MNNRLDNAAMPWGRAGRRSIAALATLAVVVATGSQASPAAAEIAHGQLPPDLEGAQLIELITGVDILIEPNLGELEAGVMVPEGAGEPVVLEAADFQPGDRATSGGEPRRCSERSRHRHVRERRRTLQHPPSGSGVAR